MDYFPHRELGVIHYKQGRMAAAIKELSHSLGSEKSDKAEQYLDRARKALIQRGQSDQAPPEINVSSPIQPFLTRAFSVMIKGTAKDDTFVRHVSVGGNPVRVDVSKPEIPFRVKVPLVPGENKILIQAEDLTGKTGHALISVNVDRRGPVVSLDEPFEDLSSSEPAVMVMGHAFDASGLAELEINGRKLPLHEAKAFQIQQRIPLESDEKEVVVKVRDRAENITTATLTTKGVPKLRFGSVPKSHFVNDWMRPFLSTYDFENPSSLFLAQKDVTMVSDMSDSLISYRMRPFLSTYDFENPSSLFLAQKDVTMVSDMSDPLISYRSGPRITDTTGPHIELRGVKDGRQITYLDQIFVDGYVMDGESGVNLLHVNGKPFFESRELPLAEGMVRKIDPDTREIGIDIGTETNIKEGMKLIVYQIGEGGEASRVAQDFRELGRARVKWIQWKESLAILDQETDEHLIKPAHRVITR